MSTLYFLLQAWGLSFISGAGFWLGCRFGGRLFGRLPFVNITVVNHFDRRDEP